ncbi:MAG: LacI family DNA-binding transcriptional regulator [Candidatus Humimicrobiaceae bacterium]
MKKNNSIYFIAKEAGVSIATISRFFNNPESLNLKTRESVAEICEKYSYQPSSYASAMVTGKTKIITLLTAYMMQPTINSQFLAIERRLTESGYLLNIINFAEDSLSRKKLKKIIRSSKTDGFICSGLEYSSICEIKESSIPAVYLDICKEFPALPSYKNNDYLGGKLAGEYLIKKDIKKLGLFYLIQKYMITFWKEEQVLLMFWKIIT